MLGAPICTPETAAGAVVAEPAALGELATSFPQADLQPLRTLIRNTLRERAQNKPPKNYRAMFQLLRDIITP